MAIDPNSDTARVLKFTGNWEGHLEASHCELEAQATALRDARQIIAARREADNWMSTLLVGMLATMEKEQLVRLELSIAKRVDADAGTRQALSLIRLANSGKEHRDRVSSALGVLQDRGAQPC